MGQKVILFYFFEALSSTRACRFKAYKEVCKGSRRSKQGKKAWCGSGESTHLPPIRPGLDSQTWRNMWVGFVPSLPSASSGFLFPGTPVFPTPKKTNLRCDVSLFDVIWLLCSPQLVPQRWILCTYWLSGRAGRHDLGPNIRELKQRQRRRQRERHLKI